MFSNLLPPTFRRWSIGLLLACAAITMGLPVAMAASPIAASMPKASAAVPVLTSIAKGLALAKRNHEPLLVAFGAVWCVPCREMEETVLTGAPWQQLGTKVIRVESDIDTPEGKLWYNKLKVNGVPTYVVFNDQGVELGRISGSFASKVFYAKINGLFDHSNLSSEQIDQLANQGIPWAVQRKIELFLTNNDVARNNIKRALAWYDQLPAKAQKTSASEPALGLMLDELRIRNAKADHDWHPGPADHQLALQIAQRRLQDPAALGCDYPTFLGALVWASDGLPKAQRTTLLQRQRASLDGFVTHSAFQSGATCSSISDIEELIPAAAQFYQAVDDKAASQALYKRAIAYNRGQIGNDLGSHVAFGEMNAQLLEEIGQTDQSLALLKKMADLPTDKGATALWYAVALKRHGKQAEALPYLALAARRLGPRSQDGEMAVVSQIVILRSLQRDREAQQVRAQAEENFRKQGTQALVRFRLDLASEEADALFRKHQPDKARQQLQSMLDRNRASLSSNEIKYLQAQIKRYSSSPSKAISE